VAKPPLAIPKVTPGTYFFSLLEPRRRGEWALVAVVPEAYVHGVSTRKVDDVLRALGREGFSSPRSRASARRLPATRPQRAPGVPTLATETR